MYHLATIFPIVRRWQKLRLPRDTILYLWVVLNELLLGAETFSAHIISGTIVKYEWTPIIFGIVSALLLLAAGIMIFVQRWRFWGSILGTTVLLISIAVGLTGEYLHLVSALLPSGPPGQRVTIGLLVGIPPVIAPLTFALIGVLGILALWREQPLDSGRLVLPAGRRLQLPFSKGQTYFLLAGLGILSSLASSVLDHALAGFENPWLWVPAAVGVFGTIAAIALGFTQEPTRGDLVTYLGAMLLLLIIGPIGTWLHILSDLTAQGQFVLERVIHGAPIMAPLLFSNMGLLGILVLLDPTPSA